MNSSFEQALVDVWRQAPVEGARVVELDNERYPVQRTPKRGLRQVGFVFDGNHIRGREQNPDTQSQWAQLAREGKRVMQFLSEGRYVANVVAGKATLYGGRKKQRIRAEPGRSAWESNSTAVLKTRKLLIFHCRAFLECRESADR